LYLRKLCPPPPKILFSIHQIYDWSGLPVSI
jgi:hypothetical protein